jgi:hypothetical protein
MIPTITFNRTQKWHIRCYIYISFLVQIMHQQMQHPIQMERSEANRVMYRVSGNLLASRYLSEIG